MKPSHARDSAGQPRWQPVHDWIIRQIESDAWPEGKRLPSVRALADLFHTSIGTVQRALEQLETDAWLRTVPKVGIFVASGSTTPANDTDYAGVTVRVDKAVVEMLSQAVQPGHVSFSSAVLGDELVPQIPLNKCLALVTRHADASVHGLVPPPGLPALRRRIAGMMLERSVACSPDDILITSGDSVAMELALAAAAPPGARIAIESPTYYGILQVIERLGMKAVPIPTARDTGISIDRLSEAMSRRHIDAIFLNPTLHNPLGFIMPDEARQQLAALAREHDIPIIEDDVFFDLVPDANNEPLTQGTDAGASARENTVQSLKHQDKTSAALMSSAPDAPPSRSMKDKQSAHHGGKGFHAIKNYLPDSTIYCSSFSKTLTPGYRVGWCVPGRYRNEIMAQMFSRNISVPSIAQTVLAEFLGKNYLKPHIESLRKRFADNTRFLHELVQQSFPAGTRHHSPRGGFIHWIEFPDHIDMQRLVKDALQQGCQISLNGIFFADGKTTQAIRICLGRALTPEVVRALSTLARCAQAQQSR